MTTPEGNPSQDNAIPLKLSRVETIHVTSGDAKVASLCFVLEDSPVIEELLDNPLPLPIMVITEVVPDVKDSGFADIYFRNLRTEEINSRYQQLIMPPDALKTLFGDLSDIFDNSEFEIQADFNQLEKKINELNPDTKTEQDALDEEDDVDPAGTLKDAPELPSNADTLNTESTDEDEKNNTDNAPKLNVFSGTPEEVVHQMLQKIQEITGQDKVKASSNKNLYKVRVTLAQAHLAQMLCISTNAPAFVLTSEGLYTNPNKGNKITVWEDFIASVEFPYVDTPEYFDATALLVQAVTGKFPYNLSVAEINELRVDLLSSLVRVASGSQQGLISLFSMINSINRTVEDGFKNQIPTKDDALNLYKETLIENMYRVSEPKHLSMFLKGTDVSLKAMQEWDEVDDMFEQSGLNRVLQDVLEENYAQQAFVLNPNATIEEILGFYSTPLTYDTFPSHLKELAKKYIQMPLMFEHNWVGENVNIERTATNAGEIAVAKMIACAVRLTRLQQITEQEISDIIPILLMVHSMTFPGEDPLSWAYLGSIRNLMKEKDDGGLLFEKLAVIGFPKEYKKYPQVYMHSLLVSFLHVLFHNVLDEWDYQTLAPSLKDLPYINQLLEDLFVAKPDDDEEQEQGACFVFLEIFKAFQSNDMVPAVLANETATFLKLVAELKILRDTNIEKDSEEWFTAKQKYVDGLFHPPAE